MSGYFTIGLLISFLSYINNFYNPMRQLAALWATFQVAIAGWDRINQILTMETNLALVPELTTHDTQAHISFSGVSFSYPNGQEVLHNVNFELQRGKTYAFVGPTGGGKTTTASLIARLYDTTKGSVLLHGRDIRSYTPEERAEKIGFILQDPYLFSGTVRDNIAYSNPRYTLGSQQIQTDLQQTGLDTLIARFDEGLDTHIQPTGDGISLGQKQLIAFIRTVLRQPELLILDEATANIDTITEQHLEQILQKLPETTTRVIIAHRLNTIESADEIFFVNSGKLLQAGSLNDAVNLLLHNKRES
jgi:ATP-binding cassette subfamily B protein